MKEHEFTVILGSISEITDAAANALFEAGCDDGSPGSCDGVVSVDFHRDAPTLEEAIQSAIADICIAGFLATPATRAAGPQPTRALAGFGKPAPVGSFLANDNRLTDN